MAGRGEVLGGEAGETKEERRMNRKNLTMKTGPFAAMALLLLVAFAGMNTVGDGTCVMNDEVTLWAGQYIDVGSVKVWHDDVYLYVKFILYEDENGCGWSIYETHVSVVVGTWEDHPQNNNLKVGKFEFTDPYDEGDKFHLYMIPWTEIEDVDDNDFDWGDTLDIAAHAVVMKYCDGEYVQEETAWGEGIPNWKNWAMSFSYKPCEYKKPSIPIGTIGFTVNYPWTSGNSYFKTTITSGGSGNAGNGEYKGWCIDLGATISSNVPYSGTLSIPSPSNVELFCKWSKINWILNNQDGHSWEVIQAAIWKIWLNEPIDGNMGSGSVTLSPSEIIEATNFATEAATHCDYRVFSGWVAVILTPTTGNQITIIEVDP